MYWVLLYPWNTSEINSCNPVEDDLHLTFKMLFYLIQLFFLNCPIKSFEIFICAVLPMCLSWVKTDWVTLLTMRSTMRSISPSYCWSSPRPVFAEYSHWTCQGTAIILTSSHMPLVCIQRYYQERLCWMPWEYPIMAAFLWPTSLLALSKEKMNLL